LVLISSAIRKTSDFDQIHRKASASHLETSIHNLNCYFFFLKWAIAEHLQAILPLGAYLLLLPQLK